jgi:hypothetical protein
MRGTRSRSIFRQEKVIVVIPGRVYASAESIITSRSDGTRYFNIPANTVASFLLPSTLK